MTFTERETEHASHSTRMVDSLVYRQVSTARRWRITKTYVTDPARSTVLLRVRFESLTGRPYRLYVLADPALSGGGDDDRGARRDDALVAWDAGHASALAASSGLARPSSGYLGAGDGWTDLREDHELDWSYSRPWWPAGTCARAVPGRARPCSS